MDNTNKEEIVPSQSSRVFRDRRGGIVVPDPPASSSNDGQAEACTARATAGDAIAKVSLERLDRIGIKPGPASSKKRARGGATMGEIPSDTTCVSSEDERGSVRSGFRTPRSGTGDEQSAGTKSVIILTSPEEDMLQGTGEDGKQKRGRGRPPTTGYFVGITEAKAKYREEQKKEIELAREQRIMALTGEELFQDPRTERDLNKAIERAKQNPSGDIANVARELLAEVLKVSKTCYNMQGKQRGDLKKAALTATAAVEVLRTRADYGPDTDVSVQLQALKDQLEESEREKRRALERIGTLEKALQEYMTSEGKKRRRGVRKAIVSNTDSTGDESGKIAKKARQKSPSLSPRKRQTTTVRKQQSPTHTRNTEMKVEDTASEFPPSSSGMELPPRDQWPPAYRPPIQGKVKIIDDVDASKLKYKVVEERKSPQKKATTSRETGEEAVNLFKGLVPLLNSWFEQKLGAVLPVIASQEIDRVEHTPEVQAKKMAKSTRGDRDDAGKEKPARETPVQTPREDTGHDGESDGYTLVTRRRRKRPKAKK